MSRSRSPRNAVSAWPCLLLLILVSRSAAAETPSERLEGAQSQARVQVRAIASLEALEGWPDFGRSVSPHCIPVRDHFAPSRVRDCVDIENHFLDWYDLPRSQYRTQILRDFEITMTEYDERVIHFSAPAWGARKVRLVSTRAWEFDFVGERLRALFGAYVDDFGSWGWGSCLPTVLDGEEICYRPPGWVDGEVVTAAWRQLPIQGEHGPVHLIVAVRQTLNLGEGKIFSDGFETGGLSRWSQVQQ